MDLAVEIILDAMCRKENVDYVCMLSTPNDVVMMCSLNIKFAKAQTDIRSNTRCQIEQQAQLWRSKSDFLSLLILEKTLKLFDLIECLPQKQQLKELPVFTGEHLRRSVKVSMSWLTKYRSNINWIISKSLWGISFM